MSTPTGRSHEPDDKPRYWDGELWSEGVASGVASVTPAGASPRIWFLRHKILTALGALLLFWAFSGLTSCGGTESTGIGPATNTVAPSAADQTAAAEATAAEQAAAEKAAAEAAATEQAAAETAAAEAAAAEQAAAETAAAEQAAAEQAAAEAAAAAPPPPPVSSVYYANCAAVRAAGADPIYRGDPGYSSKLDRDGDGIACE